MQKVSSFHIDELQDYLTRSLPKLTLPPVSILNQASRNPSVSLGKNLDLSTSIVPLSIISGFSTVTQTEVDDLTQDLSSGNEGAEKDYEPKPTPAQNYDLFKAIVSEIQKRLSKKKEIDNELLDLLEQPDDDELEEAMMDVDSALPKKN